MNAEPMACAEVRSEISARLDNEGSRQLDDALDGHLEQCASCRHYQSSLISVRRRLRVQAAGEMPDMTNEILEKIARTQHGVDVRSYLRTALVAALATAVLVGGLVLPGRNDQADTASASEIVSQVRVASRHLTEYEARFEVRERNWHPTVDERRSDVTVSFRAPDMLRVQVTDVTNYPGSTWPRDDLTVVTDRENTYFRQTPTCPPSMLPNCELSTRATTRITKNRQPLQMSSDAVTDIVLPLETLASADAVRVIGSGETVLGREAVHVQLPFWQGHVLIDAVQPSHATSFDPDATVDLWLDAENWFPLRFSVTQPGGRQPTLEARAVSIQSETSDRAFEMPKIADSVVDVGFRDGRGPRLLPGFVAELEPYRSGRTRDGLRVASYFNGLAWLTVTTTKGRPPGNLMAADVVALPEVGPVFYEPAGESNGRVVDIFDGRDHIRLESNLPRDTLLEIADSVPAEGRAINRIKLGNTVVERTDVDTVLGLSFFRRPDAIPVRYQPVNATVTRTRGRIASAAVRYRDPENEYAGGGIVVTATRNETYLPASPEPFESYEAGPLTVRWAPLRGELEWIEARTYRSIRVADFDIDLALSIARSMR